jgi:hypothetical protein
MTLRIPAAPFGSPGERATIASALLTRFSDVQTGASLDDPALAVAATHTRVVGGMIEVEVAV